MSSKSHFKDIVDIGITSDKYEAESKVCPGSRISIIIHGHIDGNKHATVQPCSATKIICPTRMANAMFPKRDKVEEVKAEFESADSESLTVILWKAHESFRLQRIPLVLGRQGKPGDQFQSSVTKNRCETLSDDCTLLQVGGQVSVTLVDDN